MPYTVVARRFKENGFGDKPFFTALYSCTSWHTFRHGEAFLKAVWKNLGMEGDFNLMEMLKEETEACYPSGKGPGKPEPEVYRKPIDEVVEVLKGKICGHGYGEEMVKRNKRSKMCEE